MTTKLVALVLPAALLMLAAVPTDAADVKDLFAIDLADNPGKEGRMIEVTYPPGARDVFTSVPALLFRDAVAPPLCPFNSHCTGTSAGAPLSLIKNTRNFAGLVALAFRSTT